ncbi:hypothetical protein GWI33_004889 [Rhynchophorus ferrugineus]|uniref:Uncharacterized protein n=1 Tax=Rhynchophorus ferrugineus TaxID=354439 RepID=A0A834IWP3_RHYFE|nr:hypothetical protein GWI33_004889 [Rhynchophorus ferrugineus]
MRRDSPQDARFPDQVNSSPRHGRELAEDAINEVLESRPRKIHSQSTRGRFLQRRRHARVCTFSSRCLNKSSGPLDSNISAK